MKHPIAHQHALPLGLLAAGLAWPGAYGFIALIMRSPYERALASAYCGAAPHASAAHCAACWIGAAAFIFAALAIALMQRGAVREISR